MNQDQKAVWTPANPSAAEGAEATLRIHREWRTLLERGGEATEDSDGGVLFQPVDGLGVGAGEVPEDLVRRAGQIVGDHVLQRLVGIGAVGQVWEAKHRRLGTTAAIKLVRPERLTKEARGRLLKEARASGRVRHSAIASAVGAGEDPDLCWVVQEFVEGGCTLATFLSGARKDDLGPEYPFRISLFFFELADGMVASHRAGVQHRDLKPANIMVTDTDRPKLTDFGLAKVHGERSITGVGTLEGTPGYMSPEQALGKALGLDYRTDIFSFGACLMHAVTLEAPFGTGDVTEVLRHTIDERPAGTPAIPGRISNDLALIAHRCLQKDPADRYQDMRAVRDELANVLDGREVVDSKASFLARSLRRVRRNPRAATLPLAVLAAGALGAMWWSADRARTRTEYRLHMERADTAIQLGRHADAFSEIDAATKIAPDTLTPWLRLGFLHARFGHYDEAEEALSRAISLGFDPEGDPEAGGEVEHLLGRALWLIARGRMPAHGDARRLIEEALVLDPEDPRLGFPLLLTAKAVEDQAGIQRALDQIEKGLTQGDPYRMITAALRDEAEGALQAGLGRLAEGYVRLKKHPGGRQEVDRIMGRLAYNLGLLKLAKQHLMIALEVDPLDDDSLINLGLAEVSAATNAVSGRPVWGEDADEELGESVQEILDRIDDSTRGLIERRPWSRNAGALIAHSKYLRWINSQETPTAPALEAIDRLRNTFDHAELADELEWSIRRQQAERARDNDEYVEAAEHYSRAAELKPSDFRSRIYGAESIAEIDGGDMLLALRLLEEAERQFQISGSAPAIWRRTSAINRICVGGRLGREDVVLSAVQDLKSRATEAPFRSSVNLLVAADALIRAPVGVASAGPLGKTYLDEYVSRNGADPSAWPEALRPYVLELQELLQGGQDGER